MNKYVLVLTNGKSRSFSRVIEALRAWAKEPKSALRMNGRLVLGGTELFSVN